MMEQSDTDERHGDAILVAGGDDMIIPHTATGLCDILYTTLMGTLDIVAEGEESITGK